MRRPAPLPAATPQERESAPAVRRKRERAVFLPSRDSAHGHESEIGDEDAFGLGAEAAQSPESTASASADPLTLTTTRDVWRAARARRRALKAEIRRFTLRSRRRRLIWMISIGAAALLIGGSALAAYSPLFAVQRITVVGASSLDAAVLEQALSDQMGTPLALVDSSEVKAALLAFPLIETYSLEAKPPHDLTVRIVERTPVGVMRSDAGYTLVDAAGVALETTPERPGGHPVIVVEGGVEGSAFASAGLVVRSLPEELRAQVTEVRATTMDDVTFTLSSGVKVVWGSADDSPTKVVTLSRLMAAKPDARSFTVSSPGAAVVS